MSMPGRGLGEKILDPATMPLLKLQFDRGCSSGKRGDYRTVWIGFKLLIAQRKG
jgi:hypothetical protein